MSKHTPGPWEVIETWHGATVISREAEWSVVTLPIHDCPPDDRGVHEANARLIAAAPELLEAAQELFKWFENSGSGLSARWERIPPEQRKIIVDRHRAAISKARGES